jgi:hypothetical protein
MAVNRLSSNPTGMYAGIHTGVTGHPGARRLVRLQSTFV